MRKTIKEYDVQFVDLAEAFDKEDFEQLVGTAEDVSALKVSHGVTAEALEELSEEAVKALVQVNEKSNNFEVNIVGLGQFVKLEGAKSAFLTDKRDVKEVSSKDNPVPVMINPTIDTDSKKI